MLFQCIFRILFLAGASKSNLFLRQAGSKDDREDLQAMDNKKMHHFPIYMSSFHNFIISNSIFPVVFFQKFFVSTCYVALNIACQGILRTAEWVRSEAGMSLVLRPS